MMSEGLSNAPKHAGTASPSGHDDAEGTDLLRAIAAGDAEALLTLYDRYSPVLLAVALRVLSDRHEAEEVLQDALTRIWFEAHSFDPERGSAITWLVTVTRNRAIDVVRTRGRRARTEDSVGLVPEVGPATPESEAAESQRARVVRDALALLSPEQRSALDLAYFGGLSHSEIAEELGWPLGTVKSRIAQAVRLLREKLTDLR